MSEPLRCQECEIVLYADQFVVCDICAGTFCKDCACDVMQICNECSEEEYPEGY